MATQRFDGAQLLAASPSLPIPQRPPIAYPFRCRDAFGEISEGSATVPSTEIKVNLHLLGKGVGWGLGIEGFAALSLYGIWRLFHFWLS